MSIEQPLDPQLIEQTKQQIRSLVAEIAQLTKTEVAPEEFYGQFLPRVVSALAAVGGAVWTLNPEGRLALQYQINIQETNLRESEERQAQHGRLLYKTISGGEALLVPPFSGPGDVDGSDGDVPAANPTEFLLLLALLKTDLENVGVVEIFQRSDSSATTQKGYLRFLVQMCDLAGDFLKSHQLRHFSDRQSLWTQLEDFTRTVHISLDPREAAYTIANEGRRLIECDRVSVAIRKGRKCHIEAVSGQDLFDKRSNMIRLLGKLATAVVASGDPIWYTGDTRDLPPQVEDALQEYVDEAHSKTVAVLPLRRPPPPEEDDPKKRVERDEPIGALIVEQIEDSRVSQSLTHRSDVVCQHSSTALANALEHQNLFLMPVWRALGKTRWIVEARTLPKTLSIAAAVLALLLVLGFWPADFTLEGKGTLEPVVRRNVFTQTDGIVEDEIPKGIVHGAFVKKDQLLLKLRSTQVETTLTEVVGKLRATEEELRSVQRELATGRMLKPEERNRLIGRQSELKQTLESLKSQWALYKIKQAQLEVRSPIDGQIITWDLRNRLLTRPVQSGDQLMQVCDPADRWRLEVHMPENRMGHISNAQRTMKNENLDVSYILALEPGKTRHGKIEEVNRSAEVRGDEGNTVLIYVTLDKAELEQLREQQKLRQGAAVTAKVHCGRRALGYVLLHDLIEFIQSRVLFRYF
jgi:multidrug efflux pump subunit AcrA (membrane-fusion protein)